MNTPTVSEAAVSEANAARVPVEARRQAFFARQRRSLDPNNPLQAALNPRYAPANVVLATARSVSGRAQTMARPTIPASDSFLQSAASLSTAVVELPNADEPNTRLFLASALAASTVSNRRRRMATCAPETALRLAALLQQSSVGLQQVDLSKSNVSESGFNLEAVENEDPFEFDCESPYDEAPPSNPQPATSQEELTSVPEFELEITPAPENDDQINEVSEGNSAPDFVDLSKLTSPLKSKKCTVSRRARYSAFYESAVATSMFISTVVESSVVDLKPSAPYHQFELPTKELHMHIISLPSGFLPRQDRRASPSPSAKKVSKTKKLFKKVLNAFKNRKTTVAQDRSSTDGSTPLARPLDVRLSPSPVRLSIPIDPFHA